VDTFYAGRLKDFSSEWQKIAEDKIILNIVKNCHIELDEGLALPSQSSIPHSVFAKSEMEKVNRQIKEFCEFGIIKECEFVDDQFLSPIFTVPKKDGDYE
jgi:hypothetical protein